MRIVMMGTGPFAVPTLQWLLDSQHRVAALITRPTPASHGRRKSPIKPMREVAQQRDLPIFEPEDINSTEAASTLSKLNADLFIVCDYGQILSATALGLAKLGGINLHASLLPKYRGAAPINWAIFHGETETGVTVIHMSPKLDAGPALVQLKMVIDAHESAADLEPRLAELGVGAVSQAIDLLAAWDKQSSIGTVQDQSLATRAPRLKKTDGLIDWSRSAKQICHQIRAMKPWPSSHTYSLRADGEPIRLILDHVAVTEYPVAQQGVTEQVNQQPGSVIWVDKNRLWVATGSSPLELLRVQPAGKRMMEIADFLRGNRLKVGDLLSSHTDRPED